MQRRDLGQNVVEIEHQQGNIDRWLVVRHTLDASHISLQVRGEGGCWERDGGQNEGRWFGGWGEEGMGWG